MTERIKTIIDCARIITNYFTTGKHTFKEYKANMRALLKGCTEDEIREIIKNLIGGDD